MNDEPLAKKIVSQPSRLGKLQDAGWQADVERWETDEDSDGSDSEAALDLSEAEVPRLMA